MPDDRQARENAIFREEMAKQRENQAERDRLKDRSIGAETTPRPTDDYIDKSLGKSMTRQEQAMAAAKRTDLRLAQEEAAEKRREAVERSTRAHEQRRKLAETAKQRGSRPSKNKGREWER